MDTLYQIRTECPVPNCGGNLKYKGWGSTMVGYYSPPGHDHDDNCRFHMYECSKGHSIRERVQRVCPNPDCDWKGKKECFCSPLGVWAYEDSTQRKIIWKDIKCERRDIEPEEYRTPSGLYLPKSLKSAEEK
jgi:hypothetical protein